MFRLAEDELGRLSRAEAHPIKANRSQIATSSQKHRDPRYLPYAFTEHGALMAANVLNSRRAVQMSVLVVRAFVRLRQILTENKELAQKLTELERKVGSHEGKIQSLFHAIRQLMTAADGKQRRIGFRT